MQNHPYMWDDYYSGLNTTSYSRPPQSFYDFPSVNRIVLRLLTDELQILKPHRPNSIISLFSGHRSMIELGCGGGTVSFQLLRYGFIDKSVLVDFSNKIRDHVEKVIDVEGFNAEFKKANVLEFRSKEKFDIVYSGGLLDHFDGKRLDSVFKKHVGLCKKGGCIVTVVPYNSRLMKMVSEMKDIPESKLRYKLFEHEEIQEFYKKNKLDIIYHARHAVSIRPHIVNKRSLEERLDNWPLVLIHNIGYIWKVYEFLEREFPKLCPKKLFEFISDCVLCYGMMHGDYLVTIARKTK